MILPSVLPVVILTVLLAVFRVKVSTAALSALAAASILSLLFFSFTPKLLFFSILEGGAVALWPVLLVIAASIFAYNYTCETGAMKVIRKLLLSISPEKSVQTLIIAFGFGSFMEGIAGYGTAVAIPAGIMASVGFKPFSAALICLTANTVSTAFGAVGIPTITLGLMTSLDPYLLTPVIAMQLFPVTLFLPFILVVMTEKSLKKALRFIPETAAASAGFTSVFMLSALYLGPQFPTIAGSLASIAAVAGVSAVLRKKRKAKTCFTGTDPDSPCSEHRPEESVSFSEAVRALSVYFLILVFILFSSPLCPRAKDFLDSFTSSIRFYPDTGGNLVVFQWVSTPGVLIAAAVFLNALFCRVSFGKVIRILFSTLRQISGAAAAIVALVSTAAVMRYSGMIDYLAFFTTSALGSMFPLFSPMTGALGTFLTGSDTSSSILFGGIQKNIGAELGLDVHWLPSANMSGATAGKMIAPQSIAVAASAVGLDKSEGELLRALAGWCAAYSLLLGVIVWFFADTAGEIVQFAETYVRY